MTRTALVTGASRGIGRGAALALAARGWDVAITARTRKEGDPTAVAPENGAPLPGSLESVSAEIEDMGRRCVPIPMDLLDEARLVPAVEEAIDALGHLDLLVNNAIYVGPGSDRLFLDTEADNIKKRVFANVSAQMILTQPAVRHMVGRGGGMVIGITSGAGQITPPAPIGRGGWAMTYAVAKAGFHRIADMLAVECGVDGIRAYNLNPGPVSTERVLAVESLAFVARFGIPPRVVGEVIAWLAESPADEVPNGAYLQAHDEARRLGLLPTDEESPA